HEDDPADHEDQRVEVVDARGDLGDRRLQVVLRGRLVGRALGKGERRGEGGGDPGEDGRGSAAGSAVHEDSGRRGRLGL
ncbi:MAG: hypothetical protein ACK559_40010, partial [bacterium]